LAQPVVGRNENNAVTGEALAIEFQVSFIARTPGASIEENNDRRLRRQSRRQINVQLLPWQLPVRDVQRLRDVEIFGKQRLSGNQKGERNRKKQPQHRNIIGETPGSGKPVRAFRIERLPFGETVRLIIAR
jgi:hypothetical protein